MTHEIQALVTKLEFVAQQFEVSGYLALPCRACRSNGLVSVDDLHAMLEEAAPALVQQAQSNERLQAANDLLDDQLAHVIAEREAAVESGRTLAEGERRQILRAEAAEAALVQAQKAVEFHRDMAARFEEDRHELKQQLRTAEAALSAHREALKELVGYAKHKPSCSQSKPEFAGRPLHHCTCGLDRLAALASPQRTDDGHHDPAT